MRKELAYTALALVIIWISCSRKPEMMEMLPKCYVCRPEDYARIPVIVVGLVTETSKALGNVHPARYNSKLLTQRWLVKVRVENVLQGECRSGIVDIFYFVDSQSLGSSGKHLFFSAGMREIFFLQRDYGELRTIDDNFSNQCAFDVFSGAHPHFVPKPSMFLTEVMTDLLLTRGDGVNDTQMAEAVRISGSTRPFGNEVTMRKLKQLAREETLTVRKSACDVLSFSEEPCERRVKSRSRGNK